MRRVTKSTLSGQNTRCLKTIVVNPKLGLNNAVDHALRPLRPVIQIALMHKDRAAGMILPGITRESQDLANSHDLCGGIKRFGHNVATDAACGQGRQHIGRRHND